MRSTGHGSCRQCAISCERVVYPAGCFESACPRLYMHEAGGRTWMGCVDGVFGVEIDVERFRRLQRTAVGFGALRVAREPLPECRAEVQRTFAHRTGGPCVNPEFLVSAAPDGYVATAVDLEGRDGGDGGGVGDRT